MLYKQAKLFKLTNKFTFSKEEFAEKLEQLRFRDCPPSMTHSLGWVPPVGDEEDAPLVQAQNGYFAVCLQIEEKILPPIVLRQELAKKIKFIQARDDRKIYKKEKNSLQDEIMTTLLPRAFTKISQIHAYFDTKKSCMVLSTTNEKRTEQFITMIKKTIGDGIEVYDIEKLSQSLTHWLQHQSYPSTFAIEKSCVLQDQNQTNRVIRCQHQDLFATSIQSFIKEGCVVKQLAIEWQDHVSFILVNNFSLQSIRFKDELISQTSELEIESAQQKFVADFFILTETMSKLYQELLQALENANSADIVPMASNS